MNSVNGVLLGGTVAAARDVTARKSPSGFKNALDDAAAPNDDTKKIAKAARGFEALMIGQVMKAAHGSDSEGWFGAGDDDESSSTAIQMAEEYLGQAMAQSGGLGIAKMVVKNLSKPPVTPPSSGQTPDHQMQTHTDSLPQLGSRKTR